MELKELNEQLEALKSNVEGKSKEEAQKEIKAFEERFNADFDSKVEAKAKELVDVAVKELNEKLNTVQEHVDAVELKSKKQGKMEGKSLAEELKEKRAEIKGIALGTTTKEVEVKTLVTRAGAITNNASGFFLPEIGQLGYKERSLYNVLPKVSVSDGNHHGVIRYRDWDESTVVRAAAMVAEGAAFPESTAAFQWYTKELRKIGDTLPVTEEFFEDEVQAASELDMFLNVNVNLVVDSQLVNGDGTGQNLDGLINHVPAYTAAASGITAANLKDLAIKVKNDITRSRGSKYRPDILVVSSSTMEDLILAKDANNNYIFDENTGTLAGLAVVIDENMPDNQMVIGDRKYARIYEKPGVALSRGMVNGQFTEDEMTIKARKRMLFLIREVDKTGFRKVVDVDAALTTLATSA